MVNIYLSDNKEGTLPFRPCVGIVLLNQEGQVFVGERIDTPGAWQMPQGGIDEGETIKTAAFRELLEETGTDRAVLLHIMEESLRYNLPGHLVKKLWNGCYQGQEQRWVFMRFTGKNTDINLNFFDTPEFSAWEWIEPKKVFDRIVPFKTETYRRVLEELEGLGV